MDTYKKLIEERIKKIEELKAINVNPYPQIFNKTNNAADILEKYKNLDKEEKTNNIVSIAGRVMTLRGMGKASFCHIQDETGKIQVYIRQEEIKGQYEVLKKVDLGDIIGIKGTVFRTKTGEISVWAKEIKLLTKSIQPLPEKFHGLKDQETKYRQRYLDLITDQDVKETFKKRTKIIKMVREFLDNYGFLEVETPTLQTTYGGASAKPFKTHLNALNMDVFLSISPELYLKRLVVGGFERVYTICKNFRNEDIDTTHNPEFTMMEFYFAYANYEKLMAMTEELIPNMIKEINGSYEMKIGVDVINFKPPFKRIKFNDFIKDETGIDIDKCRDFESLKKEIVKRKIPNMNINEAKHYGNLLDELYKRVCRPKITQPTFLTHYPVEMIALAKRNEDDPTKINTFQLLVRGAEIVKAYDELNDPIDQRKRLEEQQVLLKRGDQEAMPLDEDFLNALEIGLPPTAGYGLGIDRLVMLITGKESIKDVIFFPFMKKKEE
ncbi:lysine--tRNA ligase [Candidatus Woesearchaeota archaeon]|nr:lysine--tRNA ligase [Candidatus Woesearchaeota archaeon]